MINQNQIENTSVITSQKEESATRLRFRELKDMMRFGYPSDKEKEEYEFFASSLEFEECLIRDETPQTCSDQMKTRLEHQDRAADDLINKGYDGETYQREQHYTIGTSISFATEKHKWIKTPSPFKKEDKEYNADIYKFCTNIVEERLWDKIVGLKKKRLVNYLQVWIEVPEWIEKPKQAKYFCLFLFGNIVNEYHEKVIKANPKHFPREREAADYLNM